MATSAADRAANRAESVEVAVRRLLAEGNPHAALNLAVGTFQSEAAKVRRRRPADAALIDAELAGSLLALAAQLHTYKPTRPAGRSRVPGPADLLAMLDSSLGKGQTHG
jgi:hypothetical protein